MSLRCKACDKPIDCLVDDELCEECLIAVNNILPLSLIINIKDNKEEDKED